MKLWLDKLIQFFFQFRRSPNKAAELAIEKHNDPREIKYLSDGFIINPGEEESTLIYQRYYN